MSTDPGNLRAVSILRELDDAELAAFHALLRTRECGVREQVLQEGEPVKHLYIVCSGTVHIRRLAQKHEVLLARLGVGGFFGEINLFDPGLATASIYSMHPTLLAMASYGDLRDFMSSNPAAGYKIVSAMMAEMARRLRQTNSRLVNSIYWTPPAGAGAGAGAGAAA